MKTIIESFDLSSQQDTTIKIPADAELISVEGCRLEHRYGFVQTWIVMKVSWREDSPLIERTFKPVDLSAKHVEIDSSWHKIPDSKLTFKEGRYTKELTIQLYEV